MTQYKTLSVKLPNLQINKLKLGIKIDTEVTLKPSSNVVGDSNDEDNFPHKLLLNNTQVSSPRKAFGNGSSANVKSPKTQLHKIGQSGCFLDKILRPLLNIDLPLIWNVLKPLAKSILIPLELTEAASATDEPIHKRMFGSGVNNTALIILKEEKNDIMNKIKSLEECGLFLKSISETIKNKAKGELLGMLLGT